MNLALRSYTSMTGASPTRNPHFSRMPRWDVIMTLGQRFQWRLETARTPTWYLLTLGTTWVQTSLCFSSCQRYASFWHLPAYSLSATTTAVSLKKKTWVTLSEPRHQDPTTVISNLGSIAIEIKINWCEIKTLTIN